MGDANLDEETIFEAAWMLPVEQRAAYLQEACREDAQLRQRVEHLLKASDRAGGFMQEPYAPESVKQDAIRLPGAERIGDRIGRYKLLQQIGEGGCGVVYMAEQEEPVRRRVALKVIRLGMDTKQVIARFEAERQALALMDHPHIAKVLDAGATETGRPFFVMELVRGIRITDYCDQNQLLTAQRLELFIQVCRAVQHAHQKGIIHRDLKPSNILVTINDPALPGVPMVIDFGIAKATQSPLTERTLVTAFEQFVGTPAYMSPEQAVMTNLDIDTRSDIYSLGVLLYELLTGKTPFDTHELLAKGLEELRRTICEQEPLRPSTRLSRMVGEDLTRVARRRQVEPEKLTRFMRGDLDWIVMKCLEKSPARRYETANGLAMDLARFLANEPVLARPPSQAYRFQKLVRRNRLAFAAGAALAGAILLGSALSTWAAIRARNAEREQRRLLLLAQKSELKSRHVADFLETVLHGAAPVIAKGRHTELLREILDNAADRISSGLANEPEVQAELAENIGSTYYGIGEFTKAESMFRMALATRRAVFGTNNALVATSLASVADALKREGKWSEVEALTREALAIRLNVFGPVHWSVAVSLSDLADVLQKQGRLPEAKPLVRQALDMRRKIFGNKDVWVARSLRDLALLSRDEGNLPEAEALMKEALPIARALGSNDPEMAYMLENTGEILTARGHFAEAEERLQEALAIFRKLYGNGNDHIDLVNGLETLGHCLEQDTNRSPAEVEAVVRELLEVKKRLNHENRPDPEYVTALFWLSGKLDQQGRLPETESILREALALQDRLPGIEPATRRDAQKWLNDILAREGKPLASETPSHNEPEAKK